MPVNTLGFENEEEVFSKRIVKQLSHLDIDGVMPYSLVRLKNASERKPFSCQCFLPFILLFY